MSIYTFFVSLNFHGGRQELHTIVVKTSKHHKAMTTMMYQWTKLQRAYQPESSMATLESVTPV